MGVREEEYREDHHNSGFQVGDRVRVTRSAEDYEKGWCNLWAGDMDKKIGRECLITADHGREGYNLDDEAKYYPYFVLEKVPVEQTEVHKDVLDIQVGGSHYKEYKIQPYEFFYQNKIPHHKAAIIRRILRYDHETGKGMEDLDKIGHEVEIIKQFWREGR